MQKCEINFISWKFDHPNFIFANRNERVIPNIGALSVFSYVRTYNDC